MTAPPPIWDPGDNQKAAATLAAILVGAAGCGGQKGTEHANTATTIPQQQAPAKKKAAVTEYVGTVAGVDPSGLARSGAYFVAVAIHGSSGKVDAYICDGVGHSQSFAGKAQGGKLDFRSVSGTATLTGALAGSQVKGTVKLGGNTFQFTASEAHSVGGLYTASVSPTANRVSATSERGNVLKGRFQEGAVTTLPATVTTPEGDTKKFDFRAGGSPPNKDLGFDQYRVVLLDTGRGRGNPTTTAMRIDSSVLRQNVFRVTMTAEP